MVNQDAADLLSVRRCGLLGGIEQSGRADGLRVCNRSQWTTRRPQECAARVWISQQLLNHAAADLHALALTKAEKLVDRITSFDIEPMQVLGMEFAVENIDISRLSVGGVDIETVAGKGVRVSITGIEINVAFTYSVDSSRWLGLFSDSGQLRMVLWRPTRVSVNADVSVDDFGKPQLTLGDRDANIDYELEFSDYGSGGILMQLAKRVVKSVAFFSKNCVVSAVEQLLFSFAERVVLNYVPRLFARVSFLLPLQLGKSPTDCWAMDLSLCSIEVKEGYIQAFARAELVNVAEPADTYPRLPGPLPTPVTSNVDKYMLSVAVSPWVFDSAAWAVHKRGFKITFGNIIPPWLKLLAPTWQLGMEVGLEKPPTLSIEDGLVNVKAQPAVRLRSFDNKTYDDIYDFSEEISVSAGIDIVNQLVDVTFSHFQISVVSLDVRKCQTVWGTACVFPFVYKGTSYSECTTRDSFSGSHWCATAVGADGTYIGKYGTCSPTCAIVRNLVLPEINAWIAPFFRGTRPIVDLRKAFADGALQLHDTTMEFDSSAILAWTNLALNFTPIFDNHKNGSLPQFCV